MKSIKKLLSILLVLALAMSLFAGCGSKDGEESTGDDTAPTTEDTSNEDTATDEDAGGTDAEEVISDDPEDYAGLEPMTTEEITLTYACWGMAEKGEKEAKDAQLAAFMEAYPNITVEFVEIDQAAWADGLTSLAATGNLPDVFWVFSATEAVANEWALNVTDFVETDPDIAELYPDFMKVSKIGGNWYSMPTVLFPSITWLNKTVFEKYNEPLPSYDWTIDEFKDIAERITHPEDFYFGTSNPIYPDYWIAPYTEDQSSYGWDGEAYHFEDAWINAMNQKYEYIDTDVCEWESEEDKEKFLGDPTAWPPGFGRSAIHFDWPWGNAYVKDVVEPQSGCEILFYPMPAGPSGRYSAIVDFGVISAATEHPREAWELQKWTSWGAEAGHYRLEGYKEAGMTVASRMPVTQNAEVWQEYIDFTNDESLKQTYEVWQKTKIVPLVHSVAPGFGDFDAWMVENDIWGQLDRREVDPADVAAEMTEKANEFRDLYLENIDY